MIFCGLLKLDILSFPLEIMEGFLFAAMSAAMTMLRLQKRLGSLILLCGIMKVWLDPSETKEIASDNSRQQTRKLIKDGLIIWKPVTVHSTVHSLAP